MKWPYFLQHKLKIALLLCIILIAVFINNRIECGNVMRLGSSFTSVYEDRLVVENYIYQLSNHLHEKKYLLNELNEINSEFLPEKLELANQQIDHLVHDFKKTHLTKAEDSLLLRFQKEIESLELREFSYITSSTQQAKANLNNRYQASFDLLSGLSAVQMNEGKALYESSKKVVVSNAATAQLELAILVIIGLIIMTLIFESKKVATTFKQNPHLN